MQSDWCDGERAVRRRRENEKLSFNTEAVENFFNQIFFLRLFFVNHTYLLFDAENTYTHTFSTTMMMERRRKKNPIKERICSNLFFLSSFEFDNQTYSHDDIQ